LSGQPKNFPELKVVIFAGGMGTRISEESYLKPKPMIEIGDKPILWHIMKIYAAHGFNDFLICLGYKGYVLKEYFLNYYLHNADVTVDIAHNKIDIHQTATDKFRVTLVETGLNTRTAGRLKRVQHHLGGEDFMLTYGDGLADIDIAGLLKFHRSHDKVCTMTIVQPDGRFGGVDLDATGLVTQFHEKPKGDSHWINGGFFVLRPGIFDYLDSATADSQMWEDEPLTRLTSERQLMAYRHTGFWRCMDAMRDKVILEELWEKDPKWKVWE
jgi:glucose-1-phosphate cytidylyltransferase